VVEWLKQQGEPITSKRCWRDPDHSDGQTIGATGFPEAGSGDSDDELYDKAVAYVVESRRPRFPASSASCASATTGRAAPDRGNGGWQGVVSPPEHNGQREVLAPDRGRWPPRD
jgi:DNA segregation ATPase FtsK/SpoIIIE, S-DNA-T family